MKSEVEERSSRGKRERKLLVWRCTLFPKTLFLRPRKAEEHDIDIRMGIKGGRRRKNKEKKIK